MIKGLKESAYIVWPLWPLVFCVGLSGVIGSSGIWPEFRFLTVFISLSLSILISGRIISKMAPGFSSASWAILKENGLNYVIASVTISALPAALRILIASQIDTLFKSVVFGTLVGSLFGVLTVYVLPIVFLKKSSLAAVLAGVVFLWKNWAASTWIAGIAVITRVLFAAGVWVFRIETTPWSFSIVLVTSVVGFFLYFVAFSAASRVLLEGGEKESGTGSWSSDHLDSFGSESR